MLTTANVKRTRRAQRAGLFNPPGWKVQLEPCPTCGVGTRRPCVDNKGRPRGRNHAARVAAHQRQRWDREYGVRQVAPEFAPENGR